MSLMPLSLLPCWSLGIEMDLALPLPSPRPSEDWPLSPPWLGDFWPPAAAAAWAAACWARSFREALPRFLRSRMYSQPSPNSTQVRQNGLGEAGSRILTNAVGTWVLAIALCPQLVALVAGPADSSPDGTGRPSLPRCGAVRVLTVLGLRPTPLEMWVVNSHVLLELLECVVRPLG